MIFSLGKFVFKVIMKLYNNHDENFAFEHLIPWKGVGGRREGGGGRSQHFWLWIFAAKQCGFGVL